jgi:hypothetical protein
MGLQPLPYIVKHARPLAAPGYPWSVALIEDFQTYTNKKLQKELLRMSRRANLALALGVSEWIAWTLHTITDTQETTDYIEALWAAIIDRGHLAKDEASTDGSGKDPARDPIFLVHDWLFIIYADCATDDPDRAEDTLPHVALARHIVEDREAFDEWLNITVARFVEHFPAGDERPLPRQSLDPTMPLDTSSLTEGLADFEATLKGAPNRFLREM